MALLAEELVEEWLNRQGYFTIRGIKLGVNEIDLLAIRCSHGKIECRHIEVQASVNPVSYITKVPKEVSKSTGRASTSAKTRGIQELEIGVAEWVTKKFDNPRKVKIRNSLAYGEWTRELVINKVKHPEEIDLIKSKGVTIHNLDKIVAELKSQKLKLEGASGTHLVQLITIA